MKSTNTIFWKDGFEGISMGGIFYRSFDLNNFLKTIETRGDEVVGLKFEGNDLEVIIKDREK
jgi:hypothetical protein